MPGDPIFIIGTERSGSNLLRLLLNAHSDISVPHPPHIIRYFAELEASYGDLNQESNFRRLIRDVLSLIKTHIYPWEIEVDGEALFREAQPRDLFGIYYGVYNQYLRYAGKKRWACKSTFMIHHAERVRKTFPAARFLWLVRDPRDVAASSQRSVFNPFHPYLTAALWSKQQAEGFRLMESLPKESLMLIKYEDLIGSPEKTLRQLCEFLNEPYEPAMLEYHQGDAAKKSSGLSESWKNAASPILTNNKNKFKKHLSVRDIRQVEQAAGGMMEKLGYALEFPQNISGEPSSAEKLMFSIQDKLMSAGMEWHSLLHDKNHWLRWKRALVMKRIGWACKI